MEEALLNDDSRRRLLAVARQAVLALLEGKDLDVTDPPEPLREERGAFVTIHKGGELRGCIGLFESNRPLYETVAAMACSAAFRDPRFAPLRADEVEEIDFEISVLSPLQEISDISEICIGRHGLYITRGAQRGVLLPQVATEQGWDVETFLAQTCLKAGLPGDAWRRGAKIECFTAEVFGEKNG